MILKSLLYAPQGNIETHFSNIFSRNISRFSAHFRGKWPSLFLINFLLLQLILLRTFGSKLCSFYSSGQCSCRLPDTLVLWSCMRHMDMKWSQIMTFTSDQCRGLSSLSYMRSMPLDLFLLNSCLRWSMFQVFNNIFTLTKKVAWRNLPFSMDTRCKLQATRRNWCSKGAGPSRHSVQGCQGFNGTPILSCFSQLPYTDLCSGQWERSTVICVW